MRATTTTDVAQEREAAEPKDPATGPPRYLLRRRLPHVRLPRIHGRAAARCRPRRATVTLRPTAAASGGTMTVTPRAHPRRRPYAAQSGTRRREILANRDAHHPA